MVIACLDVEKGSSDRLDADHRNGFGLKISRQHDEFSGHERFATSKSRYVAFAAGLLAQVLESLCDGK